MNLADFALTSFDQMLGTFDHMLTKAEADPRGEALIAEKLADDMYPLATQVRFTTQQVVNTLNRLTGTSIATQNSDHTSLAEARAHIAETRELIKNAHGKGFVADDSPVSFDLPNGMAFEMSAAACPRLVATPILFPPDGGLFDLAQSRNPARQGRLCRIYRPTREAARLTLRWPATYPIVIMRL